MASFACPNVPKCPHPSLAHDVDDYDEAPMCCVDGCSCGQPALSTSQQGDGQ